MCVCVCVCVCPLCNIAPHVKKKWRYNSTPPYVFTTFTEKIYLTPVVYD